MHLNPRIALAALLILAGCAPPPPLPAQLDAPDNLPPPASIDPPPAPPPPPPPPPGNDGLYRGTGSIMRNPKGTCPGQLDMDDMAVQSGLARFGRFTGPVRRDGTVRMVSGRVRVQGRFASGRFAGTLTDPLPGCEYRLTLTRVR